MIGAPYAYNKTIHKVTSLFATLFNEIYVARENTGGDYTNQKRVPIAYGSKKKFLARLAEKPEFGVETVAIQMPRMAYQISGALVYDAERQRPRENGCRAILADGSSVWVPAPAPYRIPYELSILCKNMDEGLQIVEQILPYFRPSFGVRYKPFKGQDFTDDVNFILNSVSMQEESEGEFTERQTLSFTLQFDAIVNIWVGLNSSPKEMIKKVIVNFEDQQPLGSIIVEVSPPEAGPGDVHSIVVTADWND